MKIKQYVTYQLREAKREMLEALESLSDEVIASHEPSGHWPIAWIVEHCCVTADKYLHFHITGSYVLECEERYSGRPLREPAEGDAYPEIGELKARWTELMDSIMKSVSDLDDKRIGENLHGKEPVDVSCLRIINHINSHLRGIWFMLGQKRVDSKFPEQKTWIPDK